VNKTTVAIVGAGPYALSLAAHLAARNIEHRILGRPMLFWSQIAEAGGDRYLKSYCFGTNISTPIPGYSFADYSQPRGLETFEPCSIGDFAAYGHWFQKKNVTWVEATDVALINPQPGGFLVTLDNGERFLATNIVIATGLSYFAHVPSFLSLLPPAHVTHTSRISRFAAFKAQDVAVVGAGQSALEAAALLHEFGARPQLLVRERSILWHSRVSQSRNLWRRLRSPISGLGTGPKAWALTHFPGAMHRVPAAWRTRFVKSHLPAEGAWWLRDRVEKRIPIHTETMVTEACEKAGRVALRLRNTTDGRERQLVVDHVVAGTGYDINVEHLEFLDPKLRCAIRRLERAPRLNATFETSVPGLRFVGPASAMSFGPLFRFVVGAEYTARVVSSHLAFLAGSVS
jgi:cation diffusion facilitator CzcD-associated flavoprotein CzcO